MTTNKNPHAVALAKLGASKGGKARARKLSKKRQSEIGKLANKASHEARRRRTELAMTLEQAGVFTPKQLNNLIALAVDMKKKLTSRATASSTPPAQEAI